MAIVSALTQLGLSPSQAKHLGFDTQNGIATTGNNSQADAYQITANVNIFSPVGAAANSAKMPRFIDCPLGWVFGVNFGANTIKLFPAVGGLFPAKAVDASIDVPAGSTFLFFRDNGSAGFGTAEYWMGSVFA